MGDAVSAAGAALATVGGTITSADQLQSFRESRLPASTTQPSALPASGLGKSEEHAAPAAPASPSPAAPANDQLEQLLRKFDATEKANREMRTILDRTQGQLQALSQRPVQYPQHQQNHELPAFQTDDPELAAALNTVDQRNAKRLEQALSVRDQESRRQMSMQQQAQFKTSIERARQAKPKFKEYFTDEELNDFAKPYISNPNFVNVDWDNEMELAYKVRDYPNLESENAALRKKLEAFESKESNHKDAQRRNLSQVPQSIGARSTASGGTDRLRIADDVIRDFKKTGKRYSTQQVFAETRRRLGYGT